MRKAINSIGIFICISYLGYAQNLVPNPGFENYTSCPSTTGNIQFDPSHSSFLTIKDWTNPHKISTPDYFNACASIASGANLPNTFLAKKNARSGSGAVGIYALGINMITNELYSENIQCKLIQKLKAGVSYEISFYVSYVFSEDVNMLHDLIAIDKIGVTIDDTAIYETSGLKFYLTSSFDVVNTLGNYITDSINWTKISGTYKANGGEQFLTIGYFYDGKQPSYSVLSPGPGLFPTARAYYFIDDVSVTEKVQCDTIYQVRDTTICSFQPQNVRINSSKQGWQYYWNTGETSSGITANNFGVYWCRATNGCNLTVDTFKVKEPNVTNTFYKDTMICSGSIAKLQVPIAKRYEWNTGDTGRSINVDKEGIYYCKKIINCQITVDSIRVRYYPAFQIILGGDTTICVDDNYVLGLRQAFLQYRWNTGDTACCIPIRKSGNYTLTGFNQCESKTDSINIEVIGCSDCLFIPDAFTPNGDGKNDLFRAIARCPVYDFNIKIFNRWGEQVFISNDINKPWDGTHKGINAELDTYNYYAEYKPSNGRKKEMIKGTIILIK